MAIRNLLAEALEVKVALTGPVQPAEPPPVIGAKKQKMMGDIQLNTTARLLPAHPSIENSEGFVVDISEMSISSGPTSDEAAHSKYLEDASAIQGVYWKVEVSGVGFKAVSYTHLTLPTKA